MEYTVLLQASMKLLIDEVNEYIKQGWKPQGGICFEGNWYCQAMTRG